MFLITRRSNLMVISEGFPNITLCKAFDNIGLFLQNGKTSSDGWMSRPTQVSDKLNEGRCWYFFVFQF